MAMAMVMICYFCYMIMKMAAAANHTGTVVGYDATSLIINGQHRILFSGSIHYPRSPPQYHTQRFVSLIVRMLKSEKLYASQGGPIILSQIENEYQNVEGAFHERGPPYVRWLAKMTAELQTGVPWVMCKQDDAPDPLINACNGMRCGETFKGPNKPYKPSIWTENWTSFYQVYGEEPYLRSAQDIAFHVALFIAKKGSFVNYYMYHGGTNFGRSASAFVLTSYYDQAPLDEYGLIREPKWSHLKGLHAAVKICSRALLTGAQKMFSLGTLQQAYVFKGNSGECAAFLVNNDNRNDARVLFQNNYYDLPKKSISILPDCKTVVFNTNKVSAQYNTRTTSTSQKFNSDEKWEEYREVIPDYDNTSLSAQNLLEHWNTTKDETDYLWYTFRFQNNSSDTQLLNVQSHGHVLHAFVNGEYAGSAHGSHQNTSFTLENTIHLKNGTNQVSLLSVSVGLPDSGAYLERKVAGVHRVRIQEKDFTKYNWGYQVGLIGEALQIYTTLGAKKIAWSKFSSSSHQRLTWYKTIFDAPAGEDPVALNLNSMGKGEAWINGQSIGRYWVSFKTSKGNPSQSWYNIPRPFLKTTGNQLVLMEEEEGNPLGITIDTIAISKVCGHVTSSHPPPLRSSVALLQKRDRKIGMLGGTSQVQLNCPPGKKISNILFASLGNTTGDCGGYAAGSCHLYTTKAIVERACIGKTRCYIPNSKQYFGGDPCPDIPKALMVDAECT